TGKVGGTNVAYLAAVDDRSVSASGTDHPVYNLVRLQRDLGASSTVGLAYTDRVDGGDYNRVLGADARIIWKGIWFSEAQVVNSWTADGGGARAGQLWDVTLYDRTGRSYGNHGELVGISPTFQARSGFVNRVGIVTGRLFNRFTWYGRPGTLLEQLSTYIGISPVWRYEDFSRLRGAFEGNYSTTFLATLRGGWGLNAALTNAMQRFDGAAYAGYAVDRGADTIPFALPLGLYDLWGGSAGFNTPNRALTIGASAGYGGAPIFAEAADGRQLTLGATADWRPTTASRTSAQ